MATYGTAPAPRGTLVRQSQPVVAAVLDLERAARHLDGISYAVARSHADRSCAAGRRIADQLPLVGVRGLHYQGAAEHYLGQMRELITVRVAYADHPHAADLRAQVDQRIHRAADLLDQVDLDVVHLKGRLMDHPDPTPGDLTWLLGVVVVVVVFVILAVLILATRPHDDSTAHALIAATWSAR